MRKAMMPEGLQVILSTGGFLLGMFGLGTALGWLFMQMATVIIQINLMH